MKSACGCPGVAESMEQPKPNGERTGRCLSNQILQKTIEWRDLQDYVGQRAQRGAVLKRGWPRKITRMEARLPPAAS